MFEGFIGSETVGCELRIRDGALIEIGLLNHLLAVLNLAGVSRPKNELAHGIREDGRTHAVAFGHGLLRGLGIRREEDIVGGAVLNLAVEHTGGTEGEDHLVAGLLFKNRSQILRRSREVRSHGDVDFVSQGTCRERGKNGRDGGLNSDRFHFIDSPKRIFSNLSIKGLQLFVKRYAINAMPLVNNANGNSVILFSHYAKLSSFTI